MKILNLYSGIGGNRKLWGDEHEITAVEHDEGAAEKYAELFPNDTVVVGDAHEYLIQNFDNFDFIWSSPPCTTHTKLVPSFFFRKRVYPDMSLYQEIIFLSKFCKTYFCIENVFPYYDPIIKPTVSIGRHVFWANFNIAPTSDFKKVKLSDDYKNVKFAEKLKSFYGLNYTGNLYLKKSNSNNPAQALRNCVNPEIGLHILNEMKKGIVKNQLNLF